MFTLFKKKEKLEEENEKHEKHVPDKPQAYLTSELGKIRYEIEHHIITEQFYDNPKGFVAMLLNSGIYELYDGLMKHVGVKNPYKKEQFDVKVMQFNEGDILICVELPKPEYVPLCYRIYFVCDSTFTCNAYYTIEKGFQGGFLCMWDENKAHKNLHEIKSLEWDEQQVGLMKVMEANIIIELYGGRRT